MPTGQVPDTVVTMAKPKKTEPGVVASNRRARHEFEIGETFECGIVLKGSEVKSLRESRVTIADAYARVSNNELWLFGLHVGQYSNSGAFAHNPDRDKKLLVHRSEITTIRRALEHDGRTLVPLKLYFKDGRAKIEIAIARRRRTEDKRQAIREKDMAAEARKAMSAARYG
ncbi:MAG: SsrA-binding protein [Paracrocinitomix sp.]|jgi:SsrA-binding protein